MSSIGGRRARGTVSRGVVTTAALVMIVGTPTVAIAAPAGGVPKPAASMAAEVFEATQEDKVRALAALEVVAEPEHLIQNDRDFTFLLWSKAKAAAFTTDEIRAAAELALSGAASEQTRYIRTGIHEAKARDIKRIQRDAEAARIARETKQNAAAVIGIIAPPEMLVLSNRDFIFQLWRRAEGARVKAAAVTALDGDSAAQQAFLVSGIRDAHARDVQEEIERKHQADKEAAARATARAAKSAAAAELGVVADEGMLVLSDENFIRRIYEIASANAVTPEVAAAANRALLSTDPVVWKQFIATGVKQARTRDFDNARRKQAEADRTRARQVLAKAENGGVTPRLAEAARTALAGSDSDVDTFLRVGQHDKEIRQQSLRATTPGRRGWVARHDNGNGTISPGVFDGASSLIEDATWTVLPGLAAAECYSFERTGHSGQFLRQRDLRARIEGSDGSTQFEKDATWCAKPGKVGPGAALESFAMPGRFLRHFDGQLWAADNSERHPFDAARLFGEDSTWKAEAPRPQSMSHIMQRWLDDDALRSFAGDPTEAEQVSGQIRFRKYERARLFWSKEAGVKVLSGQILEAYDRNSLLGVKDFGAPATDELPVLDGIGRYNHFVGGGSIYWTKETGAHHIFGAIKGHWSGLGWEKSYLGYPTSSEFETPAGRRVNFQHGYVEWDRVTHLVVDRPY